MNRNAHFKVADCLIAHDGFIASIFVVFVFSAFAVAEEGSAPRFKKQQLDAKFRSEGVAVGDFNQDGKQDIVAGFVWYEAPKWTMHTIANEPPSGRGA